MKKVLIISLFLFSVIFANADGIKFIAKSAPKAGVGQNFQVQYTLNQKPSTLTLGDYSGLQLLNGPSTSTSTSINIINGKSSQENTYTYTYTFRASKTGNYTIKGATVNVNGKTYTSNPVKITIQKDPVQTNRRRNNYDPWEDFYNMMGYENNATNTQPKEITNNDLFVRVFVNKQNLYKGEHIIATVKIYTKVDLIGFEDIEMPQFNDFYVEEIEIPGRINLVRENYNNDVYNVGLIKKYILYPRVSGDLKIDACKIDCQVRQSVRGRRSLFGSYNTVSKSIRSPELNIKVNPLPQAPQGFKGAVGRFNMDVAISEDTVLVNEAISIKLTVSGNGNFKMIDAQPITWPKEFEVYEPLMSQNLRTDAGGLTGSKTWEYTIIPRYPGIFNIGNIVFSYFDTNSKQYKNLKSKDIKIAVKKEENDTDFGQNTYNYTQKNIDYISEDDIRFVNYNNLNLKNNYIPLAKKNIFIWLFILPIILFVVIAFVLRKKIKENANVAFVKQKKAGRTSQKRLKKARKFMSQDLKTEFYKEIISALWGYCGDKFEIQTAELTKDNIKDILISKNINIELIDKLLEVIEKCEFAHFAPSTAEYELNYIYKQATEIIEQLEQTIK